MVRRLVVLRSSVAGAFLLAVATAGTVGTQDTARADDSRAVSCAYVVDVAWQGGFTADLRITDNGPDIDGWTVRWSFPEPTTRVLTSWSSVLTETDTGEVTASNASYDALIRGGQVFSFGWTARGPSTAVPTDISVNGVAC